VIRNLAPGRLTAAGRVLSSRAAGQLRPHRQVRWAPRRPQPLPGMRGPALPAATAAAGTLMLARLPGHPGGMSRGQGARVTSPASRRGPRRAAPVYECMFDLSRAAARHHGEPHWHQPTAPCEAESKPLVCVTRRADGSLTDGQVHLTVPSLVVRAILREGPYAARKVVHHARPAAGPPAATQPRQQRHPRDHAGSRRFRCPAGAAVAGRSASPRPSFLAAVLSAVILLAAWLYRDHPAAASPNAVRAER
jgi:hypothetical protein